eukprot:4087924-Pleurochrysis_carterae.AAC.1
MQHIPSSSFCLKRLQIYESSELYVTHLKVTDRLDEDFHCVEEKIGSQNAAGRSINGAIIYMAVFRSCHKLSLLPSFPCRWKS